MSKISIPELADFCLQGFQELKFFILKCGFASDFDIDYEVQFSLFIAANIDGDFGKEESELLSQLHHKLGWSTTYVSMLQSRIEKQESFSYKDLKQGGIHDDFGQKLYQMAYCVARVDSTLTEDELGMLDSMGQQLITKDDRKRLDPLLESIFTGNGEIPDLSSIIEKEEEVEKPDLDECLKELRALIGLDEVVGEIDKLVSYLKIQAMRKEHGLSQASLSLHMVFTGNPGTGKTTVARIVSKIYCALGYLKKGHLIETDRSGLIGRYVGHTEAKTTEVIDEALDGVLFIDEAYSLVKESENDFGKEAIDTLVKRMEDDRDRLVVIVAGYEEEMKGFIGANPGLESRFNTYIEFEDYKQDELLEIFKLFCNANDYNLHETVEPKLMKAFSQEIEKDSNGFGNARFVRNLFEKIIRNHSFRLSANASESLSKEDLMTIKPEDIYLEE